MTDDQKAAAYYKAGMLKEAPPFVPSRVRVLREQFGDFPFLGAGVAAGEHECTCNKWGAVSVIDRAGAGLGLRLNEFEPIAWRENAADNLVADNPTKVTVEHTTPPAAPLLNFEVQTKFLFDGWQNCWTIDDGDGDDEEAGGTPERFFSADNALEQLATHLTDIERAVDLGNMVDAPGLNEFRIVDIVSRVAFGVVKSDTGKLALGASVRLREGDLSKTFDEDIIDGSPDRFDTIEIHGVRFVGDEDVEQDDENPEFFSTYLHLKEGGIACVGDFPTHAFAQRHAKSLSAQHGWPIADHVEKTRPAPRRARG